MSTTPPPSSDLLQNWARSTAFTPAIVDRPTSLDELRAMYPDTYDRFVALLARTDPTGLFRMPFVERHFPAP